MSCALPAASDYSAAAIESSVLYADCEREFRNKKRDAMIKCNKRVVIRANDELRGEGLVAH